jgi:hypothetical protein
MLEWDLPAKFQMRQLSVPQQSPHRGFRIGGVRRMRLAKLRMGFAVGR